MSETQIELLQKSYNEHAPSFRRLMEQLCFQIDHLLDAAGISLGTPLESRVKTWDSISGKVNRKNFRSANVLDLDDTIGIRLILLFKRDLKKTHDLLSENLAIISTEDTSSRLSEAQFGYQSVHYIATLPDNWENLPSMKGLTQYKVEIQVRTMAQHIWAAVSHKLQYKQESNVPSAIRRSINRASALLETVDLEFERVLSDRESYLQTLSEGSQASIEANKDLNVETLQVLLDQLLPPQNKASHEDYAELLEELEDLGITTTSQLTELINNHYSYALENENKHLAKNNVDELEQRDSRRTVHSPEDTYVARYYRNVYFTHTGLLRQCMQGYFDAATT